MGRTSHRVESPQYIPAEVIRVLTFAELIREALGALAARRPIFQSEADLQHELAIQIARVDPDVSLRLERPVRLPDTKPINLDVMLRRGDQQYALELKYVTAQLAVEVGGEEFLLKSQSAQDLRRYDILKDIARIEQLIAAGVVSGGMSVTITNDRSLWQTASRAATNDEAFRLHNGRVVTGSLGWADHAAPGTIRGREKALEITGAYSLEWAEYSQIDAPRNGDFRMLIAEVAHLQE